MEGMALAKMKKDLKRPSNRDLNPKGSLLEVVVSLKFYHFFALQKFI